MQILAMTISMTTFNIFFREPITQWRYHVTKTVQNGAVHANILNIAQAILHIKNWIVC